MPEGKTAGSIRRSEIIENGDKYLNLSSRTYIEYLAKLHQFKTYTNKLIKDN